MSPQSNPLAPYQKPQRLDKILADAGFGSRKQVTQLVKKGLVKLDGTVCKEASTHIANDKMALITVNDKQIAPHAELTFMLHKPQGYVSSLKDNKHRTVAELIPAPWQSRKLSPVGRLDIDTTGLLLLTNNGLLSHHLTAPNHEMGKTYLVTTTGKPFCQNDIALFASGVAIDYGKVLCKSAKLEIISPNQAYLTIYEGKFHQVKKMMLATEREVVTLHRLAIGDLRLDPKLPEGQMRLLTPAERQLLST